MILTRRLALLDSAQKRTFVILALIVLISALLPLAFLKPALRNLAFLHLTRTFLSPASELAVPNIERARMFFELLTHGDSNRFEAYRTRLDGLAQLLTSYPYAQLHEGRLLLAHAQLSLAEGDSKRGKELLLQSINTDAEIIQLEAHLWLARTLSAEGNTTGCSQHLKSASNFSSQILLRTDVCPGWSLEGVFVDRRELITDQAVHLLLIWKWLQNGTVNLPASMGSPLSGADGNWRIWTWHDHVFQLGIASNLIADGGFERVALPYRGLPQQFPLPRIAYLPTGFQDSIGLDEPKRLFSELVYEEPSASRNMTLLIHGLGKIPALGVSTLPIPIPARKASYLIVGRFRSSKTAAPLIGIRWLLKGWATTVRNNLSSYAVQKPSPHWMLYAGLFGPPREADALEYWILNSDLSTDLQVDDLGLWCIPVPCDLVENCSDSPATAERPL